MRKIDLSGQKFNYLKVIRENGRNKHGQVLWLCRCDCGNEKSIAGYPLRKNLIKSCGCMKNKANFKHGQRGTRLYKIWEDLKRRCDNPNTSNFQDYGGRGISYCDEWKEFIPFFNWALASGYSDELTIDRINNDGDYEPNNCRWATKEEQSRNQRVRKDSTTGVSGVYEDKRTGKYRAYFFLGSFDTLEEAVRAREKAEKKYWKSS